jgi:3-oxoacyl-[acyl-carrier protein] reductase
MVCLVTGSSRGLGKSIALAFGRRGHKVVVHCREKTKEAEEVASQIKDSLLFKSDIRISEKTKMFVTSVVRKWGRIDVLVNNAGITKEALLLKTSENDFDEIISVNLKGTMHCIRAVVPYMMKQKSGHIINISSIAGLKGKAGLSAYSASKAGLLGLTLTAAAELSRYNIMVNAVLPGYLLTDMGMNSSNKARESALKESVINSPSDPEGVAEFICYLSGTSCITGQVFNLDSRIV